MENRKRLIELLTAVRYTTNDIEKVADEICLLFNVVGRSEQLKEGRKEATEEIKQWLIEMGYEELAESL